ncbi:hypothetical protein ACFX15_029446 [Malus domestica]
MIWDIFAVDEVIDESAYVLLCLSPHASLYPSHLPYLFLRKMWYLFWKHKMLKTSTREQCQVLLGRGKKAEYFERLRWECPLRYVEGLSIFTDKLYQGNLALEVRRAMSLRLSNKQSYRGSGSL